MKGNESFSSNLAKRKSSSPKIPETPETVSTTPTKISESNSTTNSPVNKGEMEVDTPKQSSTSPLPDKASGQIYLAYPEDTEKQAEIDRTISEILNSSSLNDVIAIKKPQQAPQANNGSRGEKEEEVVSLQPKPGVSPEALLGCIDDLLLNYRRDEVKADMFEMTSLLDDILTESQNSPLLCTDDQRLRDCY